MTAPTSTPTKKKRSTPVRTRVKTAASKTSAPTTDSKKTTSAPAKKVAAKKAPAKKAPAKAVAAKTTSTKTPVKKTPSKAAAAKKVAAKKVAAPYSQELTPEGFLVGGDSAIIAELLVTGGRDRNEINDLAIKAIKKSSGLNTKSGNPKYVPSMVAAILSKMLATGAYEVQSTFQVIPK